MLGIDQRLEERRDQMVAQYQRELPEACRWLLDEAGALLNHLEVPPRHQQSVCTLNLAERAFVEERRRPQVMPLLPTERSGVPLVFAILIRVSDRWHKKSFRAVEQQQMRSFRQRRNLHEHETKSAAPQPEPPLRRRAASAA